MSFDACIHGVPYRWPCDQCEDEVFERIHSESFRSLRLRAVMDAHNVSAETAQRYLDLRDEGHLGYAARIMAGISDPSE